jgi:2-methylcitrate dehydratase
MTLVEQLAKFVCRAQYEDLSDAAREAMKIRVLDALGCAIGALDSGVARALRLQTEDFGGAPWCCLIGGGRTAPDRAAFYNSALVRYLDFNDSYLAKGETCHPSDNLGAVLAACEYEQASGRDLLTALAVAYQVQCRLSDVAPVRAKGFDHTTQGAYALAAGVARGLHLDEAQTANALAICGTAFNGLRVTRTGALSNWKGLAYANAAFGCTHAAFLAMRDITGPLEVFEGNKGFMEAIAGRFEIDWASEDLERVTRTILKRYNAEIHSQSAIEGALELQRQYGFRAVDVERVEIGIFDVAHKIIGGGEEGDKRRVRTKEEADHSLPFLVAAALTEGSVLPEQYEPERIARPAVQSLLQRVEVRPDAEFSRRFPEEMACRVTVRLRGGRALAIEKRDYEGFFTRPVQWEQVLAKFRRLAEPNAHHAAQIAEAVESLEKIPLARLTALLEAVGQGVLEHEHI